MMQKFIYFCIILAISSAMDVSVYNAHDLDNAQPGTELELLFESTFPWKFAYNDSSDRLSMAVFYRNESSSVTAVVLTYGSDDEKFEESIVTLSTGEHVTVLSHPLRGPEAVINLNLYTSKGLCKSLRVAEGRLVSTNSARRPEKTEKEYKTTDVCSKGNYQPCVLMLDLKDFVCEEINDEMPPPKFNVSICVIPSVIGAGVIILIIFLCVKKRSRQDSHAVKTMEVDTCESHIMRSHLMPPRN